MIVHLKCAAFATLIVGLAATGPAPATAQTTRSGDDKQGDWASSSEAPRDNWRARSILDRQTRSEDANHPMSGTEQGLILDNYYKSIGKGGAGAELPPRDTPNSKSSGQ